MKAKLLLVDDKEANLHALEVLLRDLNVEFVRASSGNEGLVKTLEYDFALALIDVQMPEMNGFEMVDLLRQEEKTKYLPVIFVSAIYKDEVYQIKGIESGAVDFITKPIVPQILFGKVRVLLDLYEQRMISEQKSEALRTAKKEWEKTFDAITDVVSIQDKNMRIVRINQAGSNLFGCSKTDLEGKSYYKLFQDGSETYADCQEGQSITDHADSREITYASLGKTFLVSAAPLFDNLNNITGVVHVAKDITERKKVETQLRQTYKMEAIGTLAGGIAHEFNNILAAIIGYADLASYKVAEGSEAKADLDEVLKAGLRAKELVKQILAFSHKKEERLGPVQLDLAINEAVKFLQASIPSSIEMRLDISPGCKAILADSTMIHQLLINLCTNAVQSMGTKGVLEISLSQRTYRENKTLPPPLSPGEYLLLRVSDNGPGIKPSIVERIFDPFFTTKEIGKGTGMGLSVVHGIVEKLGGLITVDSEPGKGASFQIYFSVTDKKLEQFEDDGEPILTGKERILFVDDELVLAHLGKQMLERLGYQISVRTSSVEALEAFRAQPKKFDLVITDQTMPNISGHELAKSLLEIRPDIPIILCTGYSSTIDEEKSEEIGISAFALKPIAKKDIAKLIRKVLDTK
jgi:PAS domain S-box-containing protein